MAAHADPTQSTMMDTISAAPSAEIQWLVSGRVKIKLKANGNTDLNAVYDAGPLPDDLRLLDDDDDPVTFASFVDIQQQFSIEYNGTRYCFKG